MYHRGGSTTTNTMTAATNNGSKAPPSLSTMNSGSVLRHRGNSPSSMKRSLRWKDEQKQKKQQQQQQGKVRRVIVNNVSNNSKPSLSSYSVVFFLVFCCFLSLVVSVTTASFFIAKLDTGFHNTTVVDSPAAAEASSSSMVPAFRPEGSGGVGDIPATAMIQDYNVESKTEVLLQTGIDTLVSIYLSPGVQVQVMTPSREPRFIQDFMLIKKQHPKRYIAAGKHRIQGPHITPIFSRSW